MLRYFDLSDKKLIAVLDIKNGSSMATASVEEIKKEMRWKCDVEEVNKARYEMLKKEYCSQVNDDLEK